MKRSVTVAGLSFVFGSLLALGSGSASACEPAPDHSVSIIEDDSPDCVTVSNGTDYLAGKLLVDNQCEDPITLEAEDCPGCGEAITVEAGETASMEIETRDKSSSATVTWTLGDHTGQVRAEVDWQDNSDACSGIGGCAIAGSQKARPALWATALLVLGGLARRRRSDRTRCTPSARAR